MSSLPRNALRLLLPGQADARDHCRQFDRAPPPTLTSWFPNFVTLL